MRIKHVKCEACGWENDRTEPGSLALAPCPKCGDGVTLIRPDGSTFRVGTNDA